MTLANTPRYDPKLSRPVGDSAVVVGGSVAGLLAARCLADYFSDVVVLEADEYPADPETRRGVPQGGHVHALQEAGRATLEDLFPGYGEDLLAAGGLLIDGASDIEFYSEGGFLADGSQRLPGYTATRPLFEAVVRRRIADSDAVEIRTDCRVTDYPLDESCAVEGVRFREEIGEETQLAADLVVDATGRTSKTPGWLERNGYAAPPVEEVTIDVGYSTVPVERPPESRDTVLALAEAPRVRGGAAFPVEGDRWLVNVHGVHGDHPPTDLAGVTEFASSLPVPELERLLREQSVLGEVDHYPFPSSRRRYYERLDRFPEGLVVVGDAVASFNPVYGQGMSVAALEALQLHRALGVGGLDGLAPRYFDRAASVVDTAWTMAVGADAQFSATPESPSRAADLFARYLSRLRRRAHSDPDLRVALMRVISMEQSPASLLRPRTVARVLGPEQSRLGLGRSPDRPSSNRPSKSAPHVEREAATNDR
jgi:2-polyprenyl-6-methoxyphenol hydroxylase-like FAD-dependent oxidoreductase